MRHTQWICETEPECLCGSEDECCCLASEGLSVECTVCGEPLVLIDFETGEPVEAVQ